MPSLAIEFVVDPLDSGADGARYRHVSRVPPRALQERMAATRFYHLSGGFCVVVDGAVWNAPRPLPYDPAAVECVVDAVSDALLFLESVAGQAEDGTTVRAYFTEMITVELRPGEGGELHLTGTAIMGPLSFPEIAVPARAFYAAMYQASRDFIAFTRELAGAIRSPGLPGSGDEWKTFEARLSIEQWEHTAKRLRAVLDADS